MRAQVVLHAAHGRSHACIAREAGLHLDPVGRWRGRFAQAGLPGLKDRQRNGWITWKVNPFDSAPRHRQSSRP
ncbi:helix-turn-helix domain-containing protein [Streptomyces sioyaensis]|uniref:helix-turn-helix domain-containing protein n=1 Tax=Streptomyces sioyaensis TaxID=67364 RepID=UPI0036B6EF3E